MEPDMKLKEEYRSETVIKKSRFLACVKPCTSEEEARAYIESIRREFRDASHVCTAYILGEHDEIQRSSDNHEPSGTAGVPMLEAIRHAGMSDTCACVVRWFGGIKLGAGGLIRAYSGAVTKALQEAAKTEPVKVFRYRVTYPYDLSGVLENWLRQNTEITDTMYDEDVTVTLESESDNLISLIQDLSRGQAEVLYLGTTIKDRDI
jgi:uncharacterized YigZ family protein